MLTLAACGPSSGDVGDDGGNPPIDGANAQIDAPMAAPDAARPVDAGSVFADATVFPDGGFCGEDWMCPAPVGDGCDVGGDEACDGDDDDCDGMVDEGCPCTVGEVQPCFRGPPGKRGVGACVDGSQTCVGGGEFTYWGPCEGGIIPSAEACDSLDNSCNGCVDDHPDCCDVELHCPGPGDLPEGSPFVDYVIDGTMFYAGPIASWSWTVVGGPCDQLLDATADTVSYAVSGATTSMLTFTPTLSGDYTITMTATAPDGTVYECTFVIHIGGPGLRIELCWDTTGPADIDLHVHKPDSTSPWFTTTPGGSNNINPDDCYYYNCNASAWCTLPPPFPCIPGSDQADWGPEYPNSALAECVGGPEGAQWSSYGSCRNPRLDIDNIFEAGRPENINIDRPVDGKSYRVMVHYFGGTVETHPMVNVYCGGHLRATYGAAPDLVSGFDAGGGFGDGPMWRVVDVTPSVMGGDTVDCALTPLHPPGMTSGYWVTDGDRSF